MLHEGVKGLLAIVIASLLWGTTGVTASYTADLSPLAIGAFTMGVGAIWLSLAASKSLVRDYATLRLHPKLVLFGGLCVVIYPLAFYSSMSFAGVAIGTMVSIASAPLFAAILERLFSKKTNINTVVHQFFIRSFRYYVSCSRQSTGKCRR